VTPVEKLAIQLSRVYFDGDPGPWMTLSLDTRVMLRRLARHVLRRERAAVRRARGRTVAWAIGSPVYEYAGQKDTRAIGYDWSFFEEPVNVRMTQAMGKRVARVVAVPRKGGRRAK